MTYNSEQTNFTKIKYNLEQREYYSNYYYYRKSQVLYVCLSIFSLLYFVVF